MTHASPTDLRQRRTDTWRPGITSPEINSLRRPIYEEADAAMVDYARVHGDPVSALLSAAASLCSDGDMQDMLLHAVEAMRYELTDDEEADAQAELMVDAAGRVRDTYSARVGGEGSGCDDAYQIWKEAAE